MKERLLQRRMVDMQELQKKLDKLPHCIRLGIRGGLILLTWLPICFSDTITILIAIGHICVVSVLLYNNLDLRTGEETWEAYRRSLYLELLMCIGVIIIVII